MGTCECSNEHPGSIKCEEFLDQLQSKENIRKFLLVYKTCR